MEENEVKMREELKKIYVKYGFDEKFFGELLDACCDLLSLTKEEIIVGFEDIVLNAQYEQAKALNKYENALWNGMKIGSLVMTTAFLVLIIITKIF